MGASGSRLAMIEKLKASHSNAEKVYKKMFTTYDVDSSGVLEGDEIDSFLGDLYNWLGEQTGFEDLQKWNKSFCIKFWKKYFDKSKDSKLQWEEFRGALQYLLNQPPDVIDGQLAKAKSDEDKKEEGEYASLLMAFTSLLNNDNEEKLEKALMIGDLAEAGTLLEMPDVDVNYLFHEGRTLLHSAAVMGNKESVEFLLEHGADAMIKDANGKLALDVATGDAKEAIQAAVLKKM